ncbi:MAG: hypothetical protein ACFFAH_01965 [Promethearchaeota archaeon]
MKEEITDKKTNSSNRIFIFMFGLSSLLIPFIISIFPGVIINIHFLILMTGFSIQGLSLTINTEKKFQIIFGLIIGLLGILPTLINMFTYPYGILFLIHNGILLSIYLGIIILMLGIIRIVEIIDKTYKKIYRIFVFIAGLTTSLLSFTIFIFSYINANIVYLLAIASLMIGGLFIILYGLLWEKVYKD